MKKLLSFVLCVVLIGSVAVPAFAVEASVDYCRVKIVVDGATIVPKDADGKPVEPFIWKGTTYLPVRSVANALGLEVGWEPGTVKLTSGGSRTAAIGKPTESRRTRSISMGGQDTKVTLDGKELALKDAAGDPVTPIISGGVTYLPVRAIADALHVPVLWDGETATVYLGEAIEWKEHITTVSIGGNVTTTTYTYDQWGNPLTETVVTKMKNETSKRNSTYVYDIHGNLLTKTIIESDDYENPTRTAKIENTYDDAGYLIRYSYTSESAYSQKNEIIDYMYDEQGRCVQKVETDRIADEMFISVYYYSEDGLRIEQTHSIQDKLEDEIAATYDQRGNLLTRKTSYADGTWQNETYAYDGDGNELSCHTQWIADNDEIHWENSVCSYDDRGNRISKQTEASDGSSSSSFSEYDHWDNEVRYRTTSDGEAFMDIITEYTYAGGGNFLTRATRDPRYDVEPTVWRLTYDAYGNLTSMRQDGNPREYTYTYTPIYH